jgi:hypothetical protein
MLLSKFFKKPCMFLLFLCLGTILAPSCRTSCQATSSPTPSSGSVGVALSHPFSRSMTALKPSCAVGPAPSPSESGPGTRLSPVSHLKACTAADATPGSPHRHGRLPGSHPGGPPATKWVSFSDPPVSSPSPPALPRDGPGTVSYLARCHRCSTHPVNGHRHRGWTSDLFSYQPAEARAQGEPCGHLPTALATVRPVGCTPITLYCTCI